METMVRHDPRDRKILKIFPGHTKKLCSGNFGTGRLSGKVLRTTMDRLRPRRHAGAVHQRCLWLTTLCGN
ncbi:hypothetical protein DF044_19240 [Burkholderia contaminans]|uniref:Uncharacterized protein n=1 Tax=Burkholderia contaminans TaxID=488447 RepID=A0A3N8PKI1_9BURK|nr:hypothetical protein DF044_19240 [Burkholderia contaminans]RQT28660.1 hypothetical protein DF037_15950 [Burkholderia contaminans]TCW72379.1 hypothetical protein C5O79_05770 [Burkholderia sp. SRS-25]